LAGEKLAFSFGANWQKFLRNVTEDSLRHAIRSFVDFTRRDSLQGETFLDIGCGSGLSSLVAERLGAARIVSVDIDPNSVAAACHLRDRLAPNAKDWTILRGSVLDRSFVESLGRFSFVYSWGVLHHTGALWQAVDNAADCVAPRGALFIALYNENRHSPKFLKLKRLYNRCPRFGQRTMHVAYAAYSILRMMSLGQSPIRSIREYKSHRGMSWWRDIEDWLGGLPFEYCRPDKVVDALWPKGFVLRRLCSTCSLGCNEYLLEHHPELARADRP
jgi:2-polyprenyl-6-hydroxyphenyl methylase/3-demethylubiquinone-9 3-methyltransferase